jgi:hypothetical protein
MTLTPLGRRGPSSLFRTAPPESAAPADALPTRERVLVDRDGEVVMTDEQRRQTALAIRRAAAKARSEPMPGDDEPDADLPSDPVARAIVIAGMKRRNEI